MDVLRNRAGRVELGLTNWQQARLQSILEGSALKMRAVPGRPTTPDEIRSRGEALRKIALDEARLAGEILAPWQRVREKQVAMQLGGPGLLTTPPYRQEFAITDAQVQALSSLTREALDRIMLAGTRGGMPVSVTAKPGEEGYLDQYDLWRGTAKKMFTVLTPAQRKKWVDTVGKPYQPDPKMPVPGDPRLVEKL